MSCWSRNGWNTDTWACQHMGTHEHAVPGAEGMLRLPQDAVRDGLCAVKNALGNGCLAPGLQSGAAIITLRVALRACRACCRMRSGTACAPCRTRWVTAASRLVYNLVLRSSRCAWR